MADPATKPATIDDVLAALRLTFAELKATRAELRALASHLGVGARGGESSAPRAPAIASDADLDGPDGDPEIRKDPSPKKWSGALHKGERMSACEPEYLDALASFLMWKATSDREEAAGCADAAEATKKRKFAAYAERDASLARGWARRKRAAAGANGHDTGGAAAEDDL